MTTFSPAIILVTPQLSENIGMVARAMKNVALNDLRLVDPFQDHLNRKAMKAAAGADDILQAARVFPHLKDATADLHRVYATTARRRDLPKTCLTAPDAMTDILAQQRKGKACGVVFGRERSGLTNDDLTYCDRLVTIPLNPAFTSLNLAQAVLILGYEHFNRVTPDKKALHILPKPPLAPKGMFHYFLHQLEGYLEAANFFNTPTKRPQLMGKTRDMLARAELSEPDLLILSGMINALAEKAGLKRKNPRTPPKRTARIAPRRKV